MASRTRPWRWQPKPGQANGGNMAVAAMPGMASPTTRNCTPFTLAPVMVAPGTRKCEVKTEATILFLSSIVALNPENGDYKWHYQTTPGDAWDYNSNMDIVLATLPVGGKNTRVLMHAPKNGFFYVINRENGKLISAKPFVETTWATSVDSLTGRPMIAPNARYDTGNVCTSHPVRMAPIAGMPCRSTHKQGWFIFPLFTTPCHFRRKSVKTADWKANPSKGGIAVALTDADSLPRSYQGSLQAWNPGYAKAGLDCSVQRTLECRNTNHGRQPCFSGNRGRNVFCF
jgi:hypothetical protein